MTITFNSIPSKTLRNSITAAATSFQLNDILGWDGVALAAGDFGTEHYVVFRNAAKTQIEIMEIDPSTIAATNITITRRGLQFDGDLTTEVAANKYAWTKGDTFVDIGVATPQTFQWLKEYIDAAAIAGGVDATTSVKGIVKMSTAPVSAANPIAVGDNDTRVPTQGENDALAGTSGTPSTSNKFVTEADISASGVADKIIRASSTSIPSGITGLVRKIAVSGATTDLASTGVSEYDLYSASIPGGSLGTANSIRLRIQISDYTQAASGGTVTLRLKYGSTTLATLTLAEVLGTYNMLGTIEGTLTANGSTSAQTGSLHVDLMENDLAHAVIGSGTARFVRGHANGTSTEDSTTTLSFKLTAQHSQSGSLTDFVPGGITVELIS